MVLYYSSYGHIEAMANAIAERAREAGAQVDIKRVPELVPDDVALDGTGGRALMDGRLSKPATVNFLLCREPDARFGVEMRASTNRASGSLATPKQGSRNQPADEWDEAMKTRVIIEYDLPAGDRIVVRDREEQRWITCETLLALPGSPTVKVELLEGPLMPAI